MGKAQGRTVPADELQTTLDLCDSKNTPRARLILLLLCALNRLL
jgi:hypothetical protein